MKGTGCRSRVCGGAVLSGWTASTRAVAARAAVGLSLAMVLMSPGLSRADSTFGDFTYKVDFGTGTITITGYTGAGGLVVVPEEIESTAVNEIGSKAFYNRTGITGITLPNNLCYIGTEAFYGCSGLLSVNIPDNVVQIGDNAFRGCGSLTGVTLGARVLEIGDRAFYQCGKLATFTFNSVIYSLGYEAFFGCGSLTGISIPKTLFGIKTSTFQGCRSLASVTFADDWGGGIQNQAFFECASLPSVTIPGSVTGIGEWAFYGCTGLTSVVILNGITTLENHLFRSCGSLTSVTLPASVTEIKAGVFQDCGSLAGVALPSGVTRIGDWAFSGCTNLTGLAIPGGVCRIEDATFYKCYNLTGVTIPAGVTNIGNWAFGECGRLSAVTLPNGLTRIGEYAFRNCARLPGVTLPDSVASIGPYAFSFCTALPEVAIPGSVGLLPNAAFYGCTGLVSVTIGHGVAGIDQAGFYGCSGLSSVTFPASVRNIGTDAFYQCTRLGDVAIGSGVTNIGTRAFQGCTNLTSVTFPESLVSINNSAFYGCAKLTGVTIPNGVRGIGSFAFVNCTGLTAVEIGTGFSSLGYRVFHGCTSLADIHVDANNTGFSSLDGILFDKTGSVLFTCPQGKTGPCAIPPGVVLIWDSAFEHCAGLTGVTMPDSLLMIGHNAFYECEGLTSLSIGNNVTSIGSEAFQGCAGLSQVTIPPGVTNIQSYAFEDCDSLSTVIIGPGVEALGAETFSYCGSLTGVYFMGPPPAAGANLFSGSGAVTVYYPSGTAGWGAAYGGRPTAEWTSRATFSAEGGAASFTERVYNVGSPYATLPTAERPEYQFGGWWTGAGGTGARVTAGTLVPYLASGHTLYARWVKAGGSCDPAEDDELTSAGAYDGYLYGQKEFGGQELPAVRGTLQLKVSSVAGKLTAKAVLQRGALSFSAAVWDAVGADGTRRVTLRGRGGETLELSVRQNRVWGSLAGGTVGEVLTVNGARNRFGDGKDAAAKALLDTYRGYYTVALPVAEGVSLGSAQAAPQGIGYLTVTVGNGGSAKVAGVLADGTKVTHSSRLVLFEACGPEACVPVFAPLYAKQGWVGALLWVRPNRGAVETERDLGWFVRWEKPGAGPDGFSMLLEACGGYYNTLPALAAQYGFGADVEAVPLYYGGGTADFAAAALPDGVRVTVAGTRMTLVKGVKPVQTPGAGFDYSGANSSLATLAFTAKTGLFKGKFNLYYDYELNGKLQHKAVGVPYAGIWVPVRGEAFAAAPVGLGHCLVPESDPAWKVYKIKRSFPVWLEAD